MLHSSGACQWLLSNVQAADKSQYGPELEISWDAYMISIVLTETGGSLGGCYVVLVIFRFLSKVNTRMGHGTELGRS